MPTLRDTIRACCVEIKGDRVIRNGKLVKFTLDEIWSADTVIFGEYIMAAVTSPPYLGEDTEVIGAGDANLCPRMIDGHLHVECPKMSITSLAKAVMPPWRSPDFARRPSRRE